jgi:hypothetical protein
VGHAFATLFIQLGLQHFVHFIFFVRHATRFALRPTSRSRGRGAFRTLGAFDFFEIVFQIRIVAIDTTHSRCGTRSFGSFIATTTTATTATTTRPTIFATFAIARSATGWAIFFEGNIFVDGGQFREKIVVSFGVDGVGLISKRFAGRSIEIIDRTSGPRRGGFFFIAVTTTAAATTAAARLATFFIRGAIETKSIFGDRRFFV